MRTGASIYIKAFRHPTFCISRIVAGTAGEIQRVVCWWQSPQECIRSARQMMNICPSLPMHTCFMGLPSLLFSVHCLLPVFLLVPCFSKTRVSKTHVFSGIARRWASHLIAIRPRTFAGISVRPLDTFQVGWRGFPRFPLYEPCKRLSPHTALVILN